LNTEDINDLRQKTARFYNTPIERRINSLDQTIMNYGFLKVEDPLTKINESCISTISNLSFEKAMKFLNEPDYEKKKAMILIK